MTTYVATSNKSSLFADDNVVINDDWVVTHEHQVPISSVLSAEIVDTRYKTDWHKFARGQGRFLLVTAALNTITYVFKNWLISYLLGYSLIFFINSFFSLRRESRQYVLVLSTAYGQLEVARSHQGAYVERIAIEIGKRAALMSGAAVGEAIRRPALRTAVVGSLPPPINKPEEFKWAATRIGRDTVTVWNRQYAVRDVLNAEVRKELTPMNWWPWLGLGAWVVGVVLTFFYWQSVILLILILMVLIDIGLHMGVVGLYNKGVAAWSRARRYTVVMRTLDEEVILGRTANVVGANQLAGKINRAVRDNLLAGAGQISANSGGAPTQRV